MSSSSQTELSAARWYQRRTRWIAAAMLSMLFVLAIDWFRAGVCSTPSALAFLTVSGLPNRTQYVVIISETAGRPHIVRHYHRDVAFGPPGRLDGSVALLGSKIQDGEVTQMLELEFCDRIGILVLGESQAWQLTWVSWNSVERGIDCIPGTRRTANIVLASNQEYVLLSESLADQIGMHLDLGR